MRFVRLQYIKREIFVVQIDSCQSEPFTNADLCFSSNEQLLLSLLYYNQHSLKQFTRVLKLNSVLILWPFQASDGERLMQKILLIRNFKNINGYFDVPIVSMKHYIQTPLFQRMKIKFSNKCEVLIFHCHEYRILFTNKTHCIIL